MTTRGPDGRSTRAAAEGGDIRTYLAEHPDFFERNPELLAQLRLPHSRGTSVSLVERQVEVLREQKREGDVKLAALLANGHANDALAAKMHRLACRLVRAQGLEHRLNAIEASLREDFAATDFTLVLTRALVGKNTLAPRYLRTVAQDTAEFRSFESLFVALKPRTGRVRDTQREFLFPSAGHAIGSVALVPLTILQGPAILAIGSPDADHFNPTMATEFLGRIGELIAMALDGATDTT
jgi:hypothetical protein